MQSNVCEEGEMQVVLQGHVLTGGSTSTTAQTMSFVLRQGDALSLKLSVTSSESLSPPPTSTEFKAKP